MRLSKLGRAVLKMLSKRLTLTFSGMASKVETDALAEVGGVLGDGVAGAALLGLLSWGGVSVEVKL
jgi:hypothetical protein